MSEERQTGNGGDASRSSVDRNRRRVTTAAAAAVPAFFILRPRLGAAASNASVGSGTAQATPSCSGRSPGFWKNHPGEWPAGCKPGSPMLVAEGGRRDSPSVGLRGSEDNIRYPAVGSVLAGHSEVAFAGGTPFFDLVAWGEHFQVPRPDQLSLMSVLHLPGEKEDPYRMGAYFVAAMLNAKSGLTRPLPVETVQEMWWQWVRRGYYSPSPGVDRWYAEDIKRYFETTWA
ncbi:MAG: hypothetical protein J5I81_01650 [Nitrococcus mobilis]|nr:hypothetical protein [Nitrococcus mobilis]